MADTHVAVNIGENKSGSITVNGNTYTGTGIIDFALPQGEYDANITVEGVTVVRHLVVPKSTEDIVSDLIASGGYLTPAQVNTAVTQAISAAQGYVDFVSIDKDATTYTLSFKVNTNIAPVAAKIRTTTVGNATSETAVTVDQVYTVPLISPDVQDNSNAVKLIEVLDDQNNVIDKVDLDLLSNFTGGSNVVQNFFDVKSVVVYETNASIVFSVDTTLQPQATKVRITHIDGTTEEITDLSGDISKRMTIPGTSAASAIYKAEALSATGDVLDILDTEFAVDTSNIPRYTVKDLNVNGTLLVATSALRPYVYLPDTGRYAVCCIVELDASTPATSMIFSVDSGATGTMTKVYNNGATGFKSGESFGSIYVEVDVDNFDGRLILMTYGGNATIREAKLVKVG